MDALARSGENTGDGRPDVERVHQRPPRGAVAGHRDLARGEGQAGQVVQDDVEPHPRRGPEGGGVAQEGRREVVVGQGRDVALDQRLADGVGGLRVGRRGLVDGAGGHAVDTARRHVDEALHAGGLGQGGQPHRPLVVHPVGDLAEQVAQRVVGQLGHVHHGVEAAQVVLGEGAHVAVQGRQALLDALVEPAGPVEAGVDAGQLVPRVGQLRADHGAEVAVAAGQQDAHGASTSGSRPISAASWDRRARSSTAPRRGPTCC